MEDSNVWHDDFYDPLIDEFEQQFEQQNWSSMINFANVPSGMISGLSGNEIEEVARHSMEPTTTSIGESSTATNAGRFAPAVSDEELNKIKNSSKPANTLRRNDWALRVFERWRINRENLISERMMPQSDVSLWDKEQLNYWLAKFIVECRKEDGKMYPGSSLISILSGLQQVVRKNSLVDFFKNDEFTHLREVLDASMKISTSNNVGISLKQADIITFQEEEELWSKGQLGDATPKQIIQTLFYLNGINFAVRGGQEHSDLLNSQFRVEIREGAKVLVFSVGATKTYSGGLHQRRLRPKEKLHFANEGNPQRCHIRIFELFLSKRPQNCDRFYLQSKRKVMIQDDIWFTSRPLGHNTLKKMLQTMTKGIGIQGRKTNHSLRATCASRLYNAGVDEQMIMERTGHRSVLGVRSYKRTSDLMIKNTSMILNSEVLFSEVKRQCPRVQQHACGININIRDCQVTIVNKPPAEGDISRDDQV